MCLPPLEAPRRVFIPHRPADDAVPVPAQEQEHEPDGEKENGTDLRENTKSAAD